MTTLEELTNGPAPLSRQVIVHDMYDTQVYHEAVEQYEPLQELIAHEAIPDTALFCEDVFCAFYKPVPRLFDDAQVTGSATARRHIIDEMMVTGEYERIREAGSVFNAYASILATASVCYTMLEQLDRPTRQKMQQLNKAEQQAHTFFQQAQALAEHAEHAVDEEAGALARSAAQAEAKAGRQQERAQVLAEEVEIALENSEDAIRRAARAGLKKAEQQITDTEDALRAFSHFGLEQGSPTTIQRFEEKFALAQRVMGNRKLALIARLAGKMINTALDKQRTRVLHPPDEVVGVTTGSDLMHLLPSELMLLGDEVYDMYFYMKYIEKSLMQLDMVGHEKQDKGPIQLVVDTSNSMTDPLTQEPDMSVFTKEIWSKAVALALLVIARKQGRDLALTYFGTIGQIKTFVFLKGQAQTETAFAAMEFFYNSGTVFTEWMEQSLTIAEQSRFQNSDTIVISDGDAFAPKHKIDAYNTRRQAIQMHSYGVLLATRQEVRRSRGDVKLQQVTDPGKQITVYDLAEDASALDMLFSI